MRGRCRARTYDLPVPLRAGRDALNQLLDILPALPLLDLKLSRNRIRFIFEVLRVDDYPRLSSSRICRSSCIVIHEPL